MRSITLSILSLISLMGCADVLWSQGPTPFGTPSLLPMEDHYATDRDAHGNTHHRVPVPMAAAAPARPASPRPSDGVWYQAPPPASRNVPSGYASHRMAPVGDPAGAAPDTMPPAQPTITSTIANPPPVETEGGGDWIIDGGWHDCGESVGVPCHDACCEPCCDPRYFARLGGLFFTRDRPRFGQISFDDTDLVGQVLSTHSGLGRWDAGGQVDFGWWLTPTCALEATYWGLFGGEVTTTVYAADLTGNLNTVFDLRPLNITGSGNVNDDLFDAAHVHCLRRDYEVHDVELNLLSGPLPVTAGGRLQASYLAGVRYLQFTEDFHYAAAQSNFGEDPSSEGYYDINVGNDLWGVQLGGRADWFVTPRFSLYTAPTFGIFGNYMEHSSHIHNINGSAIVGDGNPLAGEAFDISSNRTEVSFVGEIDVGCDYQFTPTLGAALGYRALAVSGLAYATDQIPNHFADLPGVAEIDHNADLILHGGYANVTVTW